MTQEEIDKIGEVIRDTLSDYLTEMSTPCWSGEIIQDHNFDDIADDLIRKLFIYAVSEPLPQRECDMCGFLIDPRLTHCGNC